jgi:RNA polymerase sigma-70 factor, ECF subfamily
MDQNEGDLLAQLATDLDHSFERLMTTYWPELYAFVLRRTANPQDADDILSEAFVRAYLALKGYPIERIRTLKLRSWLYKIAYNEYCRFIGKAMHSSVSFALVEEAIFVEQEEESSSQPEIFFETTERRQELERLVATLPDRYREAISLYYFEDLTYQEIADLLAQPIGTIKSSVHRGIQLLRKSLRAQSNEVY